MTKDKFQKAVDDAITNCIRNDCAFGSYAHEVTKAVWPLLEAAEKECNVLRADKATLQQIAYCLKDHLEVAEKERDALRARIAEMERQEPVGYMPLATKAALEAGGTGVVWNCRDRGIADEPLYALPGAKGE